MVNHAANPILSTIYIKKLLLFFVQPIFGCLEKYSIKPCVMYNIKQMVQSNENY